MGENGHPGKYVFGTVRVGEKGQIVIPKQCRDVFDIKPGDNLLVLGDINQGIGIVKQEALLDFAKAIFAAAPGVSSALITGAGFLGGCWMPLDTMGKFETVCRCLPFYPAVVLSRAAFCGGVETGEILVSLLTVMLWAVAAFVAATLAFRRVQKGTALRRGHLRCG